MRAVRAAASAAVVLVLLGCGETFDLADQTETTISEPEVPSFDTPFPDGAGVDELLPAMLESWRGLSERVIQSDREREALERIQAAWRAAEPQLRVERPEVLFGFEQAVDLATSAVERRRPADADKGFRLAVDLVDDVLTRQPSG